MVKQRKRLFHVPTPATFQITVCDRHRVVAEGVRDILAYSKEKMVLSCACRLEIEGKDLELFELGGDVVEIRGELSDLRFTEWKK